MTTPARLLFSTLTPGSPFRQYTLLEQVGVGGQEGLVVTLAADQVGHAAARDREAGQPVRAGTSGGVTLRGTLAGVLGAGLMAWLAWMLKVPGSVALADAAPGGDGGGSVWFPAPPGLLYSFVSQRVPGA